MTKTHDFKVRTDAETAETIKEYCKYKGTPIAHEFMKNMYEAILKSKFSDEKLKEFIREEKRKQEYLKARTQKKFNADCIYQVHNCKNDIVKLIASQLRHNGEINYKEILIKIKNYEPIFIQLPKDVKSAQKKDIKQIKLLKQKKFLDDFVKGEDSFQTLQQNRIVKKLQFALNRADRIETPTRK